MFREVEERVTLELLDDPRCHTVALGGGAISSERIRDALARVRVVWLDVEVDHAWERVSAGAGKRPLARDPQRFEQLYAERRPLYEAARRRDRARESLERSQEGAGRHGRPSTRCRACALGDDAVWRLSGLRR